MGAGPGPAPAGLPRPALLAAFAVALAGPLGRRLGWLGPEVSLAALSLVGWLALAGLPRASPRSAPGGAGPLALLGLALPALALGAAADLAAGLTPAELLWTAGPGLLLIGLLAAGAERARGGGLHGLGWLLGVPGLALAPALALWGRGDSSALVAQSPLGWSFLRALAPGLESPAAGVGPWGALGLCAALWALGRAGPGPAAPPLEGAERRGTRA